jgi:TonB family protein
MPDTYTAFGNFLLLKQYSQDGLGSLWRAGEMERTGFKRIVWLRRFDKPGLDRAALNAEAAGANQLSQVLKATNLIRNGAYGAENGVPYIVWDYVPAQPLDRLLERTSQEQFPVAIDNALLITEKLAAGLSAGLGVEMGGEPVIHGFLLPHLVLVGNDGEATIAGFGFTRGLRANLDRVAVQQQAAPYLAPEVLSSGNASRRSDVYSLGAILYHLLCGSALPVDPAARGAALQAPHLAAEEGPVPQDVLAVLRKCLEARPEERYGSAVEFKRELEKLLYGGAYSPTTFNLALFMDRLYRGDIELEDQEFQREKTIDVSSYLKAAEPAATGVATAPSRTILYAAIGVAVVLLGVVGFLLFGRGSSAPPVDRAAQERLLKELVDKQVAELFQAREKQIREELEAEKVKAAELRRQLDKAAAPGAKQQSAEEKAKAEQAQKELAAREAEMRRKQEELAKLDQQKQAEVQSRLRLQQSQAEARSQTVAVVATAPTAVPAVPTQAPAPTVVPPTPTTPPPQATAVPAAAQPVLAAPAGLGAGVSEGELVDFTQVDTPPKVLVEAPVNVPRSANLTRLRMAGFVILKVLVNEKGGVDDVQVLRGFQPAKPSVDEACVEAVKQYRFKPAIKNGVKVKTWLTVTRQLVLLPTR